MTEVTPLCFEQSLVSASRISHPAQSTALGRLWFSRRVDDPPCGVEFCSAQDSRLVHVLLLQSRLYVDPRVPLGPHSSPVPLQGKERSVTSDSRGCRDGPGAMCDSLVCDSHYLLPPYEWAGQGEHPLPSLLF